MAYTTQFDGVAFEREVISAGNERQHVFERVAGNLFDSTALFTDRVVVVWFERLGEFGKWCPTPYRSGRDTELRKQLQRTIHACSVDAKSLLGNFTVFERLFGCLERLEYGLAWFGNALPSGAED